MSTVLQDIYISQTSDALDFGNAYLSLKFNNDGAWQSLVLPGMDTPLMSAKVLADTVDFRIDGTWMVAKYGSYVQNHRVVIENTRQCVSLEFTVGVKSGEKPFDFEYELTSIFTLFPAQARVERSARLSRLKGASRVRLEGFRFQLPGAVIGDAAECVVDAPGPFPFWDKTTDADNFIPAATPLLNLQDHPYRFLSAPDTGFGIIAITNPARNLCLCTWMDTAGQAGYQPALEKVDQHLGITFVDERMYLLAKHVTIDSDIQRIEIAASFPAALARHRDYLQQTLPAKAPVPEWVQDMVLLEVMPQYFEQGIQGLTVRLPFYREVGFTAVHLMPHWLGGYSPIDFYAVNPELGTPEDLRDMVCTAHALGMHVLFDLVIHGFNKESPIPLQRPELFFHDDEGKLVPHPTWRSISTDWAKPEYRQYMADLATHHVEVYGIDGYRVDAASFKGPNWDPTSAYPAYASGTAAVEVLEGMIKSLRRKNPDAVLLNEVFGPHYYRVCDLSHDNMTMGPQVFLEQLAAGRLNAEHYKAHLANIMDALPEGAARVYFTRNHDTSWFYHFNGYTPAFLALDAVHVLFAIPEFFAGDPRNGPNPDDDPAIYERYRKLFALRKAFPELTRGKVLLREVASSNPMIFTGLRQLADRRTLIVISLSNKEERLSLTLQRGALSVDSAGMILFDALTGDNLVYKRSMGSSITLEFDMRPYQIVLGMQK